MAWGSTAQHPVVGRKRGRQQEKPRKCGPMEETTPKNTLVRESLANPKRKQHPIQDPHFQGGSGLEGEEEQGKSKQILGPLYQP